MVTGELSGQADGEDQFVGSQDSFFVAGVKGAVGNPAFTARRDEDYVGVASEQNGKGITGGRSVGDVAAERAAILIGDTARPRGGTAEERKFSGDEIVATNGGVGTN